MLDENNALAKSFRMARERFAGSNTEYVRLKLLSSREKDGKIYNLPDVSKVAALVVGDIDSLSSTRDIILERQDGRLKLDAYTMIESEHLLYFRIYQKELRAEDYKSLKNAKSTGQTSGSSVRKRIVLPSSFIGGRHYIDGLYHDCVAICGHVGYPDLFITFTCNSEWPEIKRLLDPLHLKPVDRPDIVCRMFKMKLDMLIKDLKKERFFSKVVVNVHTIEFQKRGLPHAHILIFLDSLRKFPDPKDIDKVICAGIPNQFEHPELYKAVKKFMLHGPCGSVNIFSPCMKEGRCSKFYPKSFADLTTIDAEGYPIYRRRKTGCYAEKGNVALDNRYVVPYNPSLLMKYQAHMNVEWCNQSRAIKYISPCEAVWRIFAYPIHSREPVVQRLSFHLSCRNPILYEDGEDIDDILSKLGIDQSMFTAWMDAKNSYSEAKELTYSEFPRFFVYNKKEKIWSQGMIVLTVALSGIAALLLPGDNNNANLPFGGKVVVFGGDFRQIFSVISGGGRTEIVNASICSSYIWDYFGDGNIDGPNDGISEIMIPTELLISNFEDPLSSIVDCIYPNLLENHLDSNWLQSREILCSTLDVVEKTGYRDMDSSTYVKVFGQRDMNIGQSAFLVFKIKTTSHSHSQYSALKREILSPSSSISYSASSISPQDGNHNRLFCYEVLNPPFNPLQSLALTLRFLFRHCHRSLRRAIVTVNLISLN
ncbi:uncharacterized protein [Arachis hypogaea]|uniref:uncharacterized protein n=1 Tax=Arachis hypogaea TaxID=3818 RepID=UPI003B21B863